MTPTSWSRRLLIVPPILLGILLLVLVVRNRQGPVRGDSVEPVRLVRVLPVPAVDVVPRAIGYGTVQPSRVWTAVPEVSGRILSVNPDLKVGTILGEGDVLVTLDPTDYELAVAREEANLRGVEAQLAEIDIKERNTRASLQIERHALSISQTDLDRKKQLLARGTAAQAAVDQALRSVLQARQAVRGQDNILALIPAERRVLLAQKALIQAKLREAQTNLDRTLITAPFDLRVASVSIERTQFVNKGQTVASGYGIDVAEVSAQIPLDRLMTLIRPAAPTPASESGSAVQRPMGAAPLEPTDPSESAESMESTESTESTEFTASSEPGGVAEGLSPVETSRRLASILGLTPTVRLRAGNRTLSWPARLARVSDTIERETRTVGVIVAVDDPYRRAKIGVRPPLTKNMFVDVILAGRPQKQRLVVPRMALHGDHVYLVNQEQRLEKRTVSIRYRQSDFAVIADGLKVGETLVITDLIPAVDGMLLQPVVDEAAAKALLASARGDGELK